MTTCPFVLIGRQLSSIVLIQQKDPNLGLTPYFKLEKRDGTSTGDPYVAFRRRTEKMQTRKVFIVFFSPIYQICNMAIF